ncbi:MAG: hypothetical protein JXQ90_02625 [Cyclobacteriaceae bacterium]
MYKFFAASIILAISLTSYSQEGDYFITEYEPTISSLDHTYFDLTFSANNELIAANRSGIVMFDGIDWTFIRTLSSAISLAVAENYEIFVGCAGDLGKIEITDGSYQFTSLDTTNGIVKQTIILEDQVVFVTEQLIHIFNRKSGEIQRLSPDQGDFFDIAFTFDGNFYIQSGNGMFALSDELTAASPFNEIERIMLVEEDIPNNQTIIVNEEGEVYMVTADKTKQLSLTPDYYTAAQWISNHQVSLSTLSNGLVIWDTKADQQIGTIDASKGLADNEIQTIAADNFGGLWLTNEFGFSRIAPDLPIRSYNYYPGLEGNLITAANQGDTWYIGTSKGIYYFDQEDKFKNVVYYVPKGETITKVASEQAPQISQEDTKRSLFGKKRKEGKSQVKSFVQKTQSGASNLLKSVSTSIKSQTNKSSLLSKISLPTLKNAKQKYDRKIRKELVSTNYLYKPVTGINEKCKKLITYRDLFLAQTSSGISVIQDNEATLIYDQPVKTMFNIEGSNLLAVSELDGGITILENDGDFWAIREQITTPGEIIITLYQDSKDRLWMAGANTLFKATIDDSVRITDSYKLNNQFFDDIRITELDEKITLVNTLGYYYIDDETASLKYDQDLLERIGKPERHLTELNGRVWVYNGDNWFGIQPDRSLESYTYLKLIPGMTYIDEHKGQFWIIDNNESLYKYKGNVDDSIPAGNMFYRKVKSKKGLINLTEKLKFDHDNSSIHIEMARPDYLGIMNIEYQYLMSGLNNQWSDWSKNNHLDFAYLPAGNYTLKVRSRDAFNRIQESEPLAVKVTPPYWETWWFKAGQILFFTTLILGSARLNRTANEKYSLLTGLLTVVTVIFIIEFLQNLAGSYLGEMSSPVLALAIDVLVALFVFPIEQVLKKIVQGASIKKMVTERIKTK